MEVTVMKLTTYLNFGGNCAEAFRFYEEHLGGKNTRMMTFEQAPDQSKIEPEWKNKVLHARIDLGDTVLMGADIPRYQPMRSVYLSLSVDSDAEAERVYSRLSDGGEIFMPMQETFFASRFAQLRDRFGTSWMILHEKPMPSGS
jgi:PhnB protein